MLLTLLVLLAPAACYRGAGQPVSFAESLRCGMTREQVRQLARERGYGNSDPSWFARRQSTTSRELSFVDLTFRGDRLVAFREDRFDPRTKRVDRHRVDLCDSERK